MSPTSRVLKQGLQGEDVARLQSALVQLGYVIPEDEVAKQFFGELTSKRVRQFQDERGLKATGEVDEDTTNRIQKEISAKGSLLEQVTVSGRVTSSPGTPIANVALLIIRREPAADTQIGTTRTSASGDYKLTYTRPAGAATAQVVVNLLDTKGQIIAAEIAHENALTVVDLVIAPAPNGQIFLVQGIVRSVDGHALGQIKVQAFDRDLRSEQQLGVAVCDKAGHYEIKYGTEQFQRAEKESGDLVFRLFAPSGEMLTVLTAADESGRPLASISGPGGSSADQKPLPVPIVFNARANETVDFVVDLTRLLSEYERFVKQLAPVLNAVALAELTPTDVEFLSGETRIEGRFIRYLSLAAQWAQATSIRPEAFYALLRYQLPDNLPPLLAVSTQAQRLALTTAVGDNVVPGSLRSEIEKILDRLHELYLQQIIGQPGNNSIGDLLGTASVSPKQQGAFVSAYLKHMDAGASADDFWIALHQDPLFPEGDVENLKFTLEVGAVTLNYLPLIQTLSQQRKVGRITSMRDLAALDAKDWESLVGQSQGKSAVDLPGAVTGEGPAEKLHNYAAMLANSFEQQFPTTALKHRLVKDSEFALPHKEDVITFLDSQPDFELNSTHIQSYLTKLGDAAFAGINDRKGLTNQLEAMQRVAHITPRYEQVRALVSQGLDSALSITQHSPEAFVKKFAQVMGGEQQAAAVYEAAEQKTATAANLLVDLHPAQAGINIRVLPHAERTAADLPDLESLFGSLDYCACEHCRSVLSPAAYLVDVLEFLHRRSASATGTTVREILFRRRPDLGEIELTCENSNTEVPYIDLVNELLENMVAPVVRTEDWQHLPLSHDKHELFQTRWSHAELQTYPEHLNSAAYATLREAVYPWTLPFDLWNEEIRVYLDQLGTTRPALVQAFRPPAAFSDSAALAIARDTMGLTTKAWNTIADTSSSRIREAWGMPSSLFTDELSHVRTFLDRSQLTFAEFTDLLATRFINPDPERRVLDLDPPESCDLDRMKIIGLTEAILGRIHRFVRLWRSLSWTMHELDLAIRVLGNGILDANCLLGLGNLKRTQATLRLSVTQTLSLWGPLDAGSPSALYQMTFWQPELRSQFGDTAFDPAQLRPSGEATEKIAHHRPHILAALNLTTADLDMLLAAIATGAAETAEASLTLDNLSFLYQHALLSRKLNRPINDLLMLKTLSEIDPFDPANNADTLRFFDLDDRIRRSRFSLDDLRLLFLVPLDSTSLLAPTNEMVAGILTEVRSALQQSRTETELVADPAGEQSRRLLSLLSWNTEVIDELIKTFTDQTLYQAELAALPDDFAFPTTLQDRITYERRHDGATERIMVSFRGVMNSTQHDTLTGASVLGGLPEEERPTYLAVINSLNDAPRVWTRRTLAAFSYVVPLATFPGQVRIPVDLATRLSWNSETHELSFAGPMTAAEQRRLKALATDTSDSVVNAYRSAVDALFSAPDAGSQPANVAFMTNAEVHSLLDEAHPADRFSILLRRLQPYLRQVLATRAVVQTLAEPLAVDPEVLQPLLTQYLNSSDTPADPLMADFLASGFAETDLNININARPPFSRLFADYRLLHNIALVLSRFQVTAKELPWLFRSTPDADGVRVNLNILAQAGVTTSRALEAFRIWLRLAELFQLRDRLGAETLRSVFELAAQPVADLRNIALAISAGSGWRADDILAVLAHLRIDAHALGDVRALTQLNEACTLMDHLSLSVEQCRLWSEPDLTLADLAQRVANGIRDALRGRYTPEQWTTVAKPLRDRLRERQAAALTAYLIAVTTDADGQPVWRDTKDLYAYFLVDVEMSACQPTTRIKLAHSSVQLFVQRCLMNLELQVRANIDEDRDWQQWEWLKNYRVWEANRQIFLYPENWIEPELRDDKTDFFKDLESELLQNDLTSDAAEDAFLNYFEKLDIVGRLEICAMYRQSAGHSTLHVFGRTRGAPHTYYYRRHVKSDFATTWTPWERVDLDIEGDYLIPVVWNDRLYLFWPLFTEQTDQQPIKMPAAGDEFQEQPRHTQMQLAWSQLRHQKWTPKTLSKEVARFPPRPEVDLYFTAFPDGGDLVVRCTIRTRPRVIPVPGPLFKFNITIPSITRRVDYRLLGMDGSMRRMPFAGSDGFIPLPWGTHLDGMTFVEDDLRFVVRTTDEGTVLVFANSPEGSADQSGGSFADRLSSTSTIPMAVPAASIATTDLRPAHDNRLRFHLPIFGTQSLLERLPDVEQPRNRFRLLLPHTQVVPVIEFFYQDSTRTFYSELNLTPEMEQSLQDLLRTIPDDGLGAILIRAFAALGIALSAKFVFHNHYHPYVRMMMQRLSRDGIEGLLQRRVQTQPQEMSVPPQPFDFSAAYGPNLRFVRNQYPIEEMDFLSTGAFAHYNWELFFHAPLLIADKLSKNQRFEEAQKWFHTIFDPTDMSGEPQPQRYWRTKPFFEKGSADYQRERIDNLLRRIDAGADDPELNNQVAQWRQHPFNPHLVARTRTTAFQRTVVMKYLDNLIAWGDQLFRQESLETINEATQLYILAAEILGPRPQQVQPRVAAPPQTYYQLAPRLDSFANALVRLENLTPPPAVRKVWDRQVEIGSKLPTLDNKTPVAQIKQPARRPTVKLPSDLYFCLLPNAKLLGYWDTVADRLFKIRHCMNLEGVVRQLSLFGEPIDPALLVRAGALGVDLRSTLSDQNAPLPQYRFVVLLQKAAELCAEVRGFGAAMLSALEKRDAEALARMRSTHELNILDQMQEVRQQQLEDARRGLEALQKSEQAITLRQQHYTALIAEFMNPRERENLRLLNAGISMQSSATALELIANILHLIPNTKVGVPVTMGVTFGGANFGDSLEAFAKYLGAQASIVNAHAGLAAVQAGHDRRAEEWRLQRQLADKELEQIDKQIAAAEIRVDLAQRELNIHRQQRRNAREVDALMRTRFTNVELYDWMSRQLSDVYFQSYQLAFDMAKRAERAFRFERGLSESDFIHFGYWDSLRKGLLAGERLQFDLRKLELAHLDQNRREHELTKHISLALLDPFALHLLRTTGLCTFRLPESLFDHDHPGHYMRRIKAVALTLPAVVGPYTSVNCRLTLQSSAVRVNAELLGGSRYLPEPDINNDSRFRSDFGSVQSIATSRGHSDTGLFEVNFRDERYLPFERAGAISTWQIELDPRCNDFDLTTLSDVVMELRYTARDGGQQLRDRTVAEVFNVRTTGPQGRLFSARTDFADAWNAFLYPIGNDPGQTLILDLDRTRFPFRAQQGEIELTELHVVLVLSDLGKRHYSRISEGGLRVIIRNPAGVAVNSDVEGLLLRTGGDPSVGGVPGAAQRLSPAARVNHTSGANRWQISIPQAIIDALPAELCAPSVAGGPTRLAQEPFEDLLAFVVYVAGS